MYNPTGLRTEEKHTLDELYAKLVERNKQLDKERYPHRFPDASGHYDTFRGSYTEDLSDSTRDNIDQVKLRRRPSWTLEEWDKYRYVDTYRTYREEWIKTVEEIDQHHINGTTGGGVKSIDRFHYKDVSYEWFVQNYERPCRPCMISGFADDWDMNRWTFDTLSQSALRDERVKVGKDSEGNRIDIELHQYINYCAHQQDDSPVYLFESDFDRTETYAKVLDAYQRPVWFSKDLFDYCHPLRRPPHRWLCVGPERSGTLMHIDPLNTNAWNTTIVGRKLWIAFPPTVPEEIATGEAFLSNDETMHPDVEDEAVGWYHRVYPKLRQWCIDQGNVHELREFIQYPGETIFVPGSWWHFVINLDDTLAVTQNYTNMSNFRLVWRDIRVNRKHTAQRWLQNLKLRYPLAYKVAVGIDKKDHFTVSFRKPHLVSKYKRRIAELKIKIKEASQQIDPEASSQDKVTDEERVEVETYEQYRSKKVWDEEELPFAYQGWERWSGSDDSSTDSDDVEDDDDDDDDSDNKEAASEKNDVTSSDATPE